MVLLKPTNCHKLVKWQAIGVAIPLFYMVRYTHTLSMKKDSHMTPIAFFTDDLALIPEYASPGLADTLGKPITVADFAKRTGNLPLSAFETDKGELVLETHTRYNLNGHCAFVRGTIHSAATA